MHRAITLHMVTDWRIVLLTLLGREAADMEAKVIFTNAELCAMRVYARNCGLAEHKDPGFGHPGGGSSWAAT